MYAGRGVERAPTRKLFEHVRMPYTRALLDAIPRLENPPHTQLPRRARAAARPRRRAGGLPVRAALPAASPRTAASTRRRSRSRSPTTAGPAGIRCGLDGARRERSAAARRSRTSSRSSSSATRGGVKAGTVHAVSGVSFELSAGETLGIVGETGSGKSTLARAILQAPPPKSGAVLLRGTDLVKLQAPAAVEARREVQMVFQDPFGSLDPKWRVARDRRGAARRLQGRRPRRSGARGSPRCSSSSGLDPARFSARRPRAALRRPGAARRDRPRARARSGADHLRRGRSPRSTC